MSARGFVATPLPRSGSPHSGSPGSQMESGAAEVGLQGRTANQGGRQRKAGEGSGAPLSSFAQIRSSWSGWAPAQEAWVVGRGKSIAQVEVGNRELFLLTPPPHVPKIPPRRRLLPCPLSPSLANSAKGADGETWRRETLDSGRATSPSLPGLPPATHLQSLVCVRVTGPGRGPGSLNPGRPGPRPHEGSLVASGPFAAPPNPRLRGECGSAGDPA